MTWWSDFDWLANPDTQPNFKYEEVFAEEYAYLVGFPDIADSIVGTGSEAVASGSFLAFGLNNGHGGSFVCSLLYATKQIENGAYPSTDDLHNAGYYEPLTFSGDSENVKYGPPNITDGAYVAVRHHGCDGSIVNSYGYYFGGTGGG